MITRLSWLRVSWILVWAPATGTLNCSNNDSSIPGLPSRDAADAGDASGDSSLPSGTTTDAAASLDDSSIFSGHFGDTSTESDPSTVFSGGSSEPSDSADASDSAGASDSTDETIASAEASADVKGPDASRPPPHPSADASDASDVISKPKVGTLDDFVDSFNDTLTRYYARCVGGAVESWRGYKILTRTAAIRQAIASGHMVYDSNSASECLSMLGNTDCGPSILSSSAPCMLAVRGQVAANEACRMIEPEFSLDSFLDECIAGTRCMYDSMSTEWTGTCHPYPTLGESCSYFNSCAAGLVCYSDVCVPPVVEEQPCRKDSPSGSECTPGLYCDGATDSKRGTCVKAKTSGTCSVGGECAWGYSCATIAGVSACARSKAPGEPCTRDQHECWGHCQTDGKCVLAAQEGEDCGAFWTILALPPSPNTPAFIGWANELISCARGLFCQNSGATTGVCRRQVAVGEACWGDLSWETLTRPQCQGSDTMLGHCEEPPPRSADEPWQPNRCVLQ